jgi:acetoacetyl-CoA synthetase
MPVPEILWEPGEELAATPFAAFRRFAEAETGRELPGYRELWEWSVGDVAAFWKAIWDFFEVGEPVDPERVLSGRMPACEWFEGSSVNYAGQVFRRAPADGPALIECQEDAEPVEIGIEQLRAEVASLAATLREAGVEPGDRVAAYLPNRREAVVGLLASAATGAIWSVCSPDFGVENAIARLEQIAPKVLIAADSYRFAGKPRNRATEVATLAKVLGPDLTVIAVSEAPEAIGGPATIAWKDAIGREAELRFEPLPFSHPLWILFSSGTTGKPKGIVQSHGGIVLEHLKVQALALDTRPGDRFYIYSSTSWMVWNSVVAALLVGATPILYDGSPAYPDIIGSFRVAARVRATTMGMGAAYATSCIKGGGHPGAELDLSALRCVISTGSPLPTSGWRWLDEELPGVRIDSASGGTDVCSTLIGGSPALPVQLGRLAAPILGVGAKSWNESGEPVQGEVGELVVTTPMPSMPIYFWDDPDGSRYHDSYFAKYEGIWRHGDWVREHADGSFEIEGRSDATLNRGGVRMGSAEIYAAVETIPAVRESLVVGVERDEGEYYMPLFVALQDGAELDEELRAEIVDSIRSKLSPRHVPDEILLAPAIPHTLTGKKLEVPIKRMFQGAEAAATVDPSAVDDFAAVEWFGRVAAGSGEPGA